MIKNLIVAIKATFHKLKTGHNEFKTTWEDNLFFGNLIKEMKCNVCNKDILTRKDG